MLSARLIAARRLVALAGVVAIGACSDASTDPSLAGLKNVASGTRDSSGPVSPDTTHSGPGQWQLKTIRGVVVGAHVLLNADSAALGETPIAGAKVEIHKIALKSSTSAAGDSVSARFQDLGVVATATTDESGRFEYILSDPIVVTSGQPSPTITYHLTITPPAGSPFAAQSDVQVWFMEQFPASQTAVNYYLFPPRS